MPATNFLNINPVGYVPGAKLGGWADYAPTMQLPSDRVFHLRSTGWDRAFVRSKGVTHHSHFELGDMSIPDLLALKNSGKTYSDVQRIETMFGLTKSGPDDHSGGYNKAWWPNGELTTEQATLKGNQVDISNAIQINETMEGDAYFPFTAQMFRPFYQTMKSRMVNQYPGKLIDICHNYFSAMPAAYRLGQNTLQFFLELFDKPLSQWPASSYGAGGSLSDTTLIVEAVYLNAPDVQKGKLLELVMLLEIIKKMGYRGGSFPTGNNEWRPNNPYVWIYPDGKLVTYNKIPLDLTFFASVSFLTQVHGKVCVEWGGGAKNLSLNYESMYHQGSLWYPGNSTSPASLSTCPYLKDVGPFISNNTGSTNYTAGGQLLFQNTFGQTVGGTRKFLDFKVGDRDWKSAENHNFNDVARAYYAKNDLMLSETLGNKMAVYYLNEFADYVRRPFQFKHPTNPNIIYTNTVCGPGVHPMLIDL